MFFTTYKFLFRVITPQGVQFEHEQYAKVFTYGVNEARKKAHKKVARRFSKCGVVYVRRLDRD